jgi:hypothetical protein
MQLPIPKPPEEVYTLGLDLGQSQDFSALAAAARRELPREPGQSRRIYHHTLRGLKRWPLGTLYTQIVRDVKDIVSQPPLAGSTLGIDRTGCGQPIVELFTQTEVRAYVAPILITAGHAVTPDGSGYHVAKVQLVSVLQRVLQSRRLDIPDAIPESETLQRELLAFRNKVTLARDDDDAAADWRTRPHDDMVLAIAIAVWLAEYTGQGGCQLVEPARDAFGPRPVHLRDRPESQCQHAHLRDRLEGRRDR